MSELPCFLLRNPAGAEKGPHPATRGLDADCLPGCCGVLWRLFGLHQPLAGQGRPHSAPGGPACSGGASHSVVLYPSWLCRLAACRPGQAKTVAPLALLLNSHAFAFINGVRPCTLLYDLFFDVRTCNSLHVSAPDASDLPEVSPHRFPIVYPSHRGDASPGVYHCK